ncbi:MAG: hypothetical protein AAFQ51_01055 [Pseudomonadota bacterium]
MSSPQNKWIAVRAWQSFTALLPEIAVLVALVKVIEGLQITPVWIPSLLALTITFMVYFIILRDLSQVIGGRPKQSRFQRFALVLGPILLAQFALGYLLSLTGAPPPVVRLLPDFALMILLAVFGHHMCAVIVREPERGHLPGVGRMAVSFGYMVGFWLLWIVVLTLLALLIELCGGLLEGIPLAIDILRALWSILVTGAGYLITALFCAVIWAAWIRDHPEDNRGPAEI